MKTGQAMVLSAKYLSKILGVTDRTIDYYLCGWKFSHIKTVFRGLDKYYKFLTSKDLQELEKLAKRRRRKCKR